MLTVDQCMALRPCPDYPRERVESLWAGRDALTAEDVAALAIPAMDRLWCLLRMAPRSVWLPAIYAAADRAIRASSGALRDAGLANESARLEHLPPIVGRRSASAASYAASFAASDAASYAAGTARAASAASNASSASDAASYAAGTARAARAASNASDARDAASFAASYAARAAGYAARAASYASYASDARDASYAARDADAADLETTVAHVARLIDRQ